MIRILHFSLILFLISFSQISSLEAKSKKPKPDAVTPRVEDVARLIFSGQFGEALQALENYPAKKLLKLERTWNDRLQFMNAYLHFQAKDFEKSAKLFGEFKGSKSPLKDYIDFYLAISLRESKQPEKAVTIFHDLQAGSSSSYLKEKIDRELALAYCEASDRGRAINLFNQLIQQELSPIKTYRLRFDRGLCLIKLGSRDEALVALRTLYLNYPEGDLSREIAEVLVKQGGGGTLSASDHMQRGEQLLNNHRPELAVLDFQAAMAEYGGSAPVQLRKKLANAHFKARQYPQAAETFEEIHENYPGDFTAEEEIFLAQSYSRSDQFDKAIRTYEEMLQRDAPEPRDRLLYKIAFLHMDKGDYPRANQLFSEFLENYPRDSRRAQIHWHLAWNHYLLKKYDQALSYLNLLEQDFPQNDISDRVPYWRARILEIQGQTQNAQSNYRQIAERDPFSYYGFLSLKRLENNLDPEKPPRQGWTRDLPKLSIPPPFSLARVNAGGGNGVERLKELLAVGLWEDFLGELDQITAGEGIASDLGESQNAYTVLEDSNASGGGNLWAGRYPAAYATLVRLFSAPRNFPMHLTWAIMREESRFRPDALSPAQAIGLMQIIPPTGMEIAKALSRKGFVPEQLYRPVVNIEYGVHYLQTNRKKFEGNLPQTIASYNAGPDAVTRWIKARPDREWDEFIEEIPYTETHNYVKKVLKSYYIYSLIYSPSD